MEILTASAASRPAAADSVAPARLRLVTTTSLFDGHDAAIDVMRRLIQSQRAEVVHRGHHRSVEGAAINPGRIQIIV